MSELALKKKRCAKFLQVYKQGDMSLENELSMIANTALISASNIALQSTGSIWVGYFFVGVDFTLFNTLHIKAFTNGDDTLLNNFVGYANQIDSDLSGGISSQSTMVENYIKKLRPSTTEIEYVFDISSESGTKYIKASHAPRFCSTWITSIWLH